MMKNHTILCSTGFIMTGDTLNRRTERGSIIHYAGISPFNTQEIEIPPRPITFGTTSGDLALGQKKLGPRRFADLQALHDHLPGDAQRGTVSPKNLHFVIVFSHAQIKEFKKKQLILQQVDCVDLGEGSDKYPSYLVWCVGRV